MVCSNRKALSEMLMNQNIINQYVYTNLLAYMLANRQVFRLRSLDILALQFMLHEGNKNLSTTLNLTKCAIVKHIKFAVEYQSLPLRHLVPYIYIYFFITNIFIVSLFRFSLHMFLLEPKQKPKNNDILMICGQKLK